MCGEYDTNYIKNHNHVYKDGICSCGEKEINHIHTYKYGICECGEYQNHIHKYLHDKYRVCYCGYIDKHIHNYIEGKCSCGIKEGKDDINIIDFLPNDYEIKYIQDYEYIFNYKTVTFYYHPNYNIGYSKLIDWLINEINVQSVAIENFDVHDFQLIEENLGVKELDYVHYDYLYYLEFWCNSTVYVTIYESGYIRWYNPQDRKEYISMEKVDYYKPDGTLDKTEEFEPTSSDNVIDDTVDAATKQELIDLYNSTNDPKLKEQIKEQAKNLGFDIE